MCLFRERETERDRCGLVEVGLACAKALWQKACRMRLGGATSQRMAFRIFP